MKSISYIPHPYIQKNMIYTTKRGLIKNANGNMFLIATIIGKKEHTNCKVDDGGS